jgi:hypothetical protein
MQILCSVISFVKKSLDHKNLNSQKCTTLNNTSCQFDSCWHTDSQSLLLITLVAEGHAATGSGALFKFPKFLGSTSCVYIHMCVCVCACVRVGVGGCVCARVRACVRAICTDTVHL